MSPRNQSGYDPVGDPRTGRPPLPDERERLRQGQPDEMDPSRRSSFTGGEAEGEELSSGSILGEGETSRAAQSLKEAGEAVTSRVTSAAASALEQGSALASTASGQVQNYTEDLVAFARRRPLAALLGAAVIGLLIGLLSRSRS